jgi:hypothetical protein
MLAALRPSLNPAREDILARTGFEPEPAVVGMAARARTPRGRVDTGSSGWGAQTSPRLIGLSVVGTFPAIAGAAKLPEFFWGARNRGAELYLLCAHAVLRLSW